MSTKYRVKDNDKAHFVTITTVEWVKLFSNPIHQKTIFNALRFCQEQKGLDIYAYVLMPSHLHMICSAKEGFRLAMIMRDFKKHTARQIIFNIQDQKGEGWSDLLKVFKNACAHLKRDQQHKVWLDGYHGKELFSNKFIYQKLNYIHRNPVVAGLSENPEDFLLSSARNYAGLPALLEIELLPHQLKIY